ncbi:MAG: alpha/beta hydrolase [Alistipes sp.]|nr:alpha/beta hydrolase [Alistipes sp.]
MKKVLSLLALAVVALTAQAEANVKIESSADEVITVWDNNSAPHSSNQTKPEVIKKSGSGYKVSRSAETVFYLFKPQQPTGHSLIIFPGGGYSTVNIGFGMAEWLRDNGITAMVVKYRLPNGNREVPLEDAAAAVEYLRGNASALGIDPQKIGVSGSSAGGHLAAWSSAVLEGEQRPNFAVLLYPVINGQIWTAKAQWSTFHELLGKWRTPVDIENHSVDLLVTPQTPPTLILHSDDDVIAPAYNSTLYYKALKRHGVKASMHIYPSGGHGWRGSKKFEYRQQWLEATKEWILAF